ncbi:MAG: hypothetical protein PHQ43_10095 [Dehalococcoidales bacterium]|nr:hypothetical protein [Dehalococcoidales bacterium]
MGNYLGMLKISKKDLDVEGYLTRDKFKELVAQDLAKQGKNLVRIDFFEAGIMFSVKESEDMYRLYYDPSIFPERGIKFNLSKLPRER